MTVAIAAEFPWGEWKDVLSSLSPKGRFRGAIILAADTRWSYEGRPPEDKGRKLWILGGQVGLVLAGDVWSGEEGIAKLREAGNNASFAGPRDVTDLAEKVLRETYAAHKEAAHRGQRACCGPLYYLMGMVDRHGATTLVRFSSEGNFSPIFLSGVHVIGVPSARAAVRESLLEAGKVKDGDGLSPDDVEAWALSIAGVLDNVIQAGSEFSVGGRVQIAIGTSEGWREIGTSILDAGTDAEVHSNWRDASYPLHELNTAEKSSLWRLAACETTELGIEEILA